MTDVVRAGSGPVTAGGSLLPVLQHASRDLAPGAIAAPSLSPGITDLRFCRARGAEGYGWCPLMLTAEVLAGVHGHDERVPVDEFERGVEVMTDVVVQVATSAPTSETPLVLNGDGSTVPHPWSGSGRP